MRLYCARQIVLELNFDHVTNRRVKETILCRKNSGATLISRLFRAGQFVLQLNFDHETKRRIKETILRRTNSFATFNHETLLCRTNQETVYAGQIVYNFYRELYFGG